MFYGKVVKNHVWFSHNHVSRGLLSLGGAVEENRLCKNKQKFTFLKFKCLPELKKKLCHATFFNSDKILSFLKGHFFDKGFCHFGFVFVSCVCLSVILCSLCLLVFLPPLLEVQCPNFLDIWNPWKKVMERSGLRYEPTS